MKILVVDDAKFLRTTLRSIFEKNEHEIVGEAENGEQAIQQFKELKPDLITMDITMPVMDGIEAIKEIMKIDSQAKIIVCSAVGQKKVVIEAIEAGAKDFIVKPFNEAQVIDTVNRVMKQSK